MRHKRPKIPEPIKLKLWVLAAGRCEFPGCNDLVWRDGLTLKEDNFAHVAHIVAASPKGPRGDGATSLSLAASFENLMLVCLKHSKLIDGKNSSDYSTDQLKAFKHDHEERIRRQTAIGPDMATTVVRFMANIRDRRADVSLAQAYEATHPRYPADDKGVLLDFTNKAGAGDVSFWAGFAQDISSQVKQAFASGNDRRRYEHLSIFAIGPIPLLIHFGNQIGNIIPADLYQKHRDTDDWNWKREPRGDAFEYTVRKKNLTKRSTNVALILSLSGKIHPLEIQKSLPGTPSYEISIRQPGFAFLPYRSRLRAFRNVYREILTEIRSRHGSDCAVHLFPAIPAPIAVMCGKELVPKSDPRIVIYDNDHRTGGFNRTLTVN